MAGGGVTHDTGHMQRSEDNSVELVLSFPLLAGSGN